jgi:molecular chaperone GrpE (heat shock protein)
VNGSEELARTDDAPPPATGQDVPGLLGELTHRLGQVEEHLAGIHRIEAHRESIIDQLHEENQRFREGVGRLALEPVVTDLIRLHDQMEREARRLGADGQDGELVRSFDREVLEILDRCGIELFSAEPGDPLQHGRHRPVGAVACDDESRHNTVAEVVAAGFYERDTGRVRRPVQAYFHQYGPPAQPDQLT